MGVGDNKWDEGLVGNLFLCQRNGGYLCCYACEVMFYPLKECSRRGYLVGAKCWGIHGFRFKWLYISPTPLPHSLRKKKWQKIQLMSLKTVYFHVLLIFFFLGCCSCLFCLFVFTSSSSSSSSSSPLLLLYLFFCCCSLAFFPGKLLWHRL